MIGLCATARADDSVRAAAGADDAIARADRALAQARMRLDPSSEISEVVKILDERIDAAPKDTRAWLKLGDALAIGFARSRHADSPLAARRRAVELDPENCDAAALAAHDELADGRSEILRKWMERPPCAAILFLRARAEKTDELALLEKSIALAPSAEALVAFGAAHLRRGKWAEAQAAFRAALAAPTLFPGDWRPDGWVQVHAQLGLAVVYAKLKQPKKMRAAKTALHQFLDEPGPWHDLSDEEKHWARESLGEKF